MARGQYSSALAEIRQDMRIGETYYRLIGPMTVSYIPTAEGWTCYVNGLAGWLGSGGTPEHAFDELKVQLHTAFQTLLRKRPFEMTEEEHSKWVQLTSVIDLLHYKTTTPMITHEIGRVSLGKIARPHHIEWINGARYQIDPQKVPGELMSCRTGQWIEAVVHRNPVSHAILGIDSIRKISFRIPSESELKSVWEAMPEAKAEPGEWVW
jgi:desulfoferrodoxin (superoxide reductase-like protein)